MSFMSEVSTKENSRYYDTKYASVDVSNVGRSSYIVRKGESLWNIAKDYLKNKDASNAEVQEMMYKIAKLNNKDSLESINDIKEHDVIYLPEDLPVGSKPCYVGDWFEGGPGKVTTPRVVEKSGAEMAAESASKIKEIIELQDPAATYGQRQLYRLSLIKKIPEQLKIEHGKAGVKYWQELLLNPDEKSMVIEKSYTYSPVQPSALHIVKKSDGPYSQTEAHLYVQADKDGRLKYAAFYTPGVQMNNISFDFTLDKNGSLAVQDRYANNYKEIEKLSKEEYGGLIEVLQKYLDKELKASN